MLENQPFASTWEIINSQQLLLHKSNNIKSNFIISIGATCLYPFP